MGAKFLCGLELLERGVADDGAFDRVGAAFPRPVANRFPTTTVAVMPEGGQAGEQIQIATECRGLERLTDGAQGSRGAQSMRRVAGVGVVTKPR